MSPRLRTRSCLAFAASALLAACASQPPAPQPQHARPEEPAGQDHAHPPHAPGHPHAHASGHPRGDHFHHRFEDAEQWARVFDDPERDAWQKPDEVIAALELEPSAKLADLGAGTGYFAMRLAREVPEGVVYAVDIEPDMVHYLRARAEREKLDNVVPVLAATDDARLPEPVDLVLIVDTYHHIADRVAYFQKLAAALRPGGRLAIIDFELDSPFGPPPEHRLAPATVASELERAGYTQIAAHAMLPYQYFLVFARQPAASAP